MNKCSFNNCDNTAFVGEVDCILHCKKNDYQVDINKIGFLESFYIHLTEYITDKLSKYPPDNAFPAMDQLQMYMKGTENKDLINKLSKYLKDKIIIFDKIKFPERDGRDYFDYKPLLDRIGGGNFDRCEFYVSSLDLKKAEVFFQECIFHECWHLYNHKLLKNVRNVLYEMCIFKKDVSTISSDYEKPELNQPIFSDCHFEKGLILENIVLGKRLFCNSEDKILSMNNMRLSRCTFNDQFILNSYEIDEFICLDSYFIEKVEFKMNKLNSFEITNTNFSKLVDCYKSSFKKFGIKKSIFEDFVNFEECEYGLIGDEKNKEFVAFLLYATMLSFINFRKAKFFSGLDLAHINLMEPPNFLHAFVSVYNSNRETFRVIKHSFDKVGNYIEANNFYEKEMLKFKEETKLNKKYKAYFLLLLYEITSNYGQNYFRPFILTIVSAVLYWLTIIGYNNNSLYEIYPPLNKIVGGSAKILNGIASHIIPFNKVLHQGMESASLFFYLLFTIFIWLIILAIKRNTKR